MSGVPKQVAIARFAKLTEPRAYHGSMRICSLTATSVLTHAKSQMAVAECQAADTRAKSRKGEVRAQVIQNADSAELHSAIKGKVSENSVLYTDSHRGYYGLSEYRCSSVNHGLGEYVRGDVHTNGIESFWAILKRAHYGTFHQFSKKHLSRYVNEFVFKANTKELPAFNVNDIECGINTFRAYVAGMEGRRLTYKELTANG